MNETSKQTWYISAFPIFVSFGLVALYRRELLVRNDVVGFRYFLNTGYYLLIKFTLYMY